MYPAIALNCGTPDQNPGVQETAIRQQGQTLEPGSQTNDVVGLNTDPLVDPGGLYGPSSVLIVWCVSLRVWAWNRGFVQGFFLSSRGRLRRISMWWPALSDRAIKRALIRRLQIGVGEWLSNGVYVEFHINAIAKAIHRYDAGVPLPYIREILGPVDACDQPGGIAHHRRTQW